MEGEREVGEVRGARGTPSNGVIGTCSRGVVAYLYVFIPLHIWEGKGGVGGRGGEQGQKTGGDWGSRAGECPKSR